MHVVLNNHIIMMTTTYLLLHSLFLTITLLLPSSTYALNLEGTTLLHFKHSLLQTWNESDRTPCSWWGVTCAPPDGPVIALSLPNSHLTGPIPDLSRLQHLRSLDLSHNSLNGTLADVVTTSLWLQRLQVLNLSHNKLSGAVPGGFDSVSILDLSSNSLTGALPLELQGANLKYLNLSNNNLSGFVFSEFARKIPADAVVDLSYNNFTGEIPQMLSNQKPDYFAGNVDLCGRPLNKTCLVPSSHSLPPNVSSDVYPSVASAAIAALPKAAADSDDRGGRNVNLWKIVAIVVGDVAAVMTLVVIFLYGYQFRKKKKNESLKELVAVNVDRSKKVKESPAASFDESGGCFCFGGGIEDETSEALTLTDDNDYDYGNDNNNNKCLVMVDGETELETETLLKASAYVLGSSGGSIVYKAVVGGDVAFAVRRMGECGFEKMEDFEKIVRGLSKLRHRNLVKVRGFYWGEEEKLVIYDYVSNGNLAAAAYEKVGSSTSCYLSFEIRLKIAKGVTKGLSYIHEKKHVHGNMKPNNILLTPEMDPVISDLGLDWLISGKTNYASNKRSISSLEDTTISLDHHHHHPTRVSPYQAPESMNTLKSNPKWDVYSFGIILLELFTGKVFSSKELALMDSDLTIADMATRSISTMEVQGRKDCFMTCLKLGFSCASLVPHKRPSMKEVLQVLEKIP